MPNCIQYCLSNTDRVDHPDAKGYLCLQHCGLCYESPFIVVDGETYVGESDEHLLAMVTGSDDR